jgi:tetratricopeptide (TPR) repeat protein
MSSANEDMERDRGQSAARAHADRGGLLQAQGKLEEALFSFDRALALDPDYSEALNARGTILFALGRMDEALSSFGKAIALKPHAADGFYNRAVALQKLGRLEEALASYDRAAELDPNAADAAFNRADVLFALERFEEALACYDRAIALRPGSAESYNSRGKALQKLNRLDEALKSYERAITLKSNFAEAFNNRGVALHMMGRYDDALLSYDRALALEPKDAFAWNNRGLVLKDLRRPKEAISDFNRAIALKEEFSEAFFNRALAELALGDFRQGWADYEHRRGVKVYAPARAPIDAPEWSGEDLGGRSILVCSEQGNGDIIQFCRYLPLLADRGAEVAFLIPQRLSGLLSGLSDRVRLQSSVSVSDRFDFQCALMSLPYRLETNVSNIPSSPSNLRTDARRVERWRETIGARGLKIGISWQGGVWQGGPAVTARSFPLSELRPLARLEGVRLVSLQKNLGVEQLETLPPDMMVETLGEDFDAGPDAFVDTAAAMESLDLVVACDTSIAHLAAALGRPVWVALKYAPDWRWGLEGQATSWYPSMRLFRQRTPNDWGPVFREMAAELKTVIARP